MGHLTRIANCIVHSTDKGPNSALVQQLIKGKSFHQFSWHLCGIREQGRGFSAGNRLKFLYFLETLWLAHCGS